jgi:hypothetical protein
MVGAILVMVRSKGRGGRCVIVRRFFQSIPASLTPRRFGNSVIAGVLGKLPRKSLPSRDSISTPPQKASSPICSHLCSYYPITTDISQGIRDWSTQASKTPLLILKCSISAYIEVEEARFRRSSEGDMFAGITVERSQVAQVEQNCSVFPGLYCS